MGRNHCSANGMDRAWTRESEWSVDISIGQCRIQTNLKFINSNSFSYLLWIHGSQVERIELYLTVCLDGFIACRYSNLHCASFYYHLCLRFISFRSGFVHCPERYWWSKYTRKYKIKLRFPEEQTHHLDITALPALHSQSSPCSVQVPLNLVKPLFYGWITHHTD